MELLKPNDYTYIAKIKQSEVKNIDFHLCVGAGTGGRQTLEKFYAEQQEKPQLVINGGYFNMTNGESVFVYKTKGKVIMDYGNVDYYHGIGTVEGRIQGGYYLNYPFDNFLTGYPVLIDRGLPTQGYPGSNDGAVKGTRRRTAIGYNKDYIYVLCADDPGLTISEMQDIFIKYGCEYAVNLDGGGSSRMLYEGNVKAPAATNRAVDNVIAFYLKKDEPKILFRVQIGAYGSKINAEKMLQKIKDAGYPQAYVRLINGLYKVQIGAFSNKENANKLIKELKSKGFSAFIASSSV